MDDMLGWRSHIVFTPDTTWQPPVDVYETDTQLIVRVEIAGVDVGDLDIHLDRDSLVIAGARADPASQREEIRCVHHREIDCGRFERIVRLPARVARQDIRAHLKDGFLEITLGKEKERPEPFSVDVS